jgi:large subunit ribosomal protein L10
MPKTKKQKTQLVEDYKVKLRAAKAVYLVRPSGLTPNETTAIKKELYNVGASMNTVKNTLFEIALKEEGLPEFESLAQGPHIVLFAGDMLSEAAKVLQKAAKDTEKLEAIAGILNKEKISAAQITALADLPSKEALLGQLLSVFNGPIRGMVTVLSGNIREMVQVLNAIKDTKTA